MKFLSLPPLVLVALSALLLAAALPPVNAVPLGWVGLAPLLYAAARAPRARDAALLGFACGLLLYALTMYWVVGVMARYGRLSYLTSVLVACLLVAYLACYVAAFAAFAQAAVSRGGRAALWTAPFAWVALEYVRNYCITGFPWNPLALTQHRWPALIQVASLGGIYAVSLLVASSSAALAYAMLALAEARSRRNAWAGVAVCVLIPVLAAAGGAVALGHAGESSAFVRAAVVQPNISQDEKLAGRDALRQLERHIELSRGTAPLAPRYLVWPESSVPFTYGSDDVYRREVAALAKEMSVFVTLGSVTFAGSYVHNSAITVTPEGEPSARYDKMHLVPFGEYVPLGEILFFVEPLVREVGNFRPGLSRPLGKVGYYPFGTVICYEIIFPELSRASVERGAQFLVTITNDAWFGRSSAPYQHFAHAVFRAVETRRPVVRAANTGISGFVDAYGRIRQESAIFEETALVETIRPREDKTVYVRWGDWLPKFSLLVAFLTLVRVAWPPLLAFVRRKKNEWLGGDEPRESTPP
ncbi:MAG: apolipoprotein N-acyltransferase [Acidobacteriota bacterium]|nr:MAG: apolipoprotein N-acyltransferase [Acidobacteriota bacterium]